MEVSSVHARGQPERTAADEVGDRGEGARRAELEGGAEGVAEGEAEQRCAVAVGEVFGRTAHVRRVPYNG